MEATAEEVVVDTAVEVEDSAAEVDMEDFLAEEAAGIAVVVDTQVEVVGMVAHLVDSQVVVVDMEDFPVEEAADTAAVEEAAGTAVEEVDTVGPPEGSQVEAVDMEEAADIAVVVDTPVEVVGMVDHQVDFQVVVVDMEVAFQVEVSPVVVVVDMEEVLDGANKQTLSPILLYLQLSQKVFLVYHHHYS